MHLRGWGGWSGEHPERGLEWGASPFDSGWPPEEKSLKKRVVDVPSIVL